MIFYSVSVGDFEQVIVCSDAVEILMKLWVMKFTSDFHSQSRLGLQLCP